MSDKKSVGQDEAAGQPITRRQALAKLGGDVAVIAGMSSVAGTVAGAIGAMTTQDETKTLEERKTHASDTMRNGARVGAAAGAVATLAAGAFSWRNRAAEERKEATKDVAPPLP